jgi:hypothetical protein
MGVSGQRHALAAVYPSESTSCTKWIGGCVGLRAGLGTEARGKILCPCQGSNSGRPVCSQTLYLLSYASSYSIKIKIKGICVEIEQIYQVLNQSKSQKGWHHSRANNTAHGCLVNVSHPSIHYVQWRQLTHECVTLPRNTLNTKKQMKTARAKVSVYMSMGRCRLMTVPGCHYCLWYHCCIRYFLGWPADITVCDVE